MDRLPKSQKYSKAKQRKILNQFSQQEEKRLALASIDQVQEKNDFETQLKRIGANYDEEMSKLQSPPNSSNFVQTGQAACFAGHQSFDQSFEALPDHGCDDDHGDDHLVYGDGEEEDDEGQVEEHPMQFTDENDSDETISETDIIGVFNEFDSDNEDQQLVGDSFSRNSSDSGLTQFEIKLAKMVLSGSFTEKQGDMVIDLIRDSFNANTRKTKAVVNRLTDQSFRHLYYILCDTCKNMVKMHENNFVCSPCKKGIPPNPATSYVAFSLIDQINVLSEQVSMDNHLDQNTPLTLRLFLTCDGIPLSQSSSVNLYPLIVYIENFENFENTLLVARYRPRNQ